MVTSVSHCNNYIKIFRICFTTLISPIKMTSRSENLKGVCHSIRIFQQKSKLFGHLTPPLDSPMNQTPYQIGISTKSGEGWHMNVSRPQSSTKISIFYRPDLFSLGFSPKETRFFSWAPWSSNPICHSSPDFMLIPIWYGVRFMGESFGGVRWPKSFDFCWKILMEWHTPFKVWFSNRRARYRKSLASMGGFDAVNFLQQNGVNNPWDMRRSSSE